MRTLGNVAPLLNHRDINVPCVAAFRGRSGPLRRSSAPSEGPATDVARRPDHACWHWRLRATCGSAEPARQGSQRPREAVSSSPSAGGRDRRNPFVRWDPRTQRHYDRRRRRVLREGVSQRTRLRLGEFCQGFGPPVRVGSDGPPDALGGKGSEFSENPYVRSVTLRSVSACWRPSKPSSGPLDLRPGYCWTGNVVGRSADREAS